MNEYPNSQTAERAPPPQLDCVEDIHFGPLAEAAPLTQLEEERC